MKKSLIVFALFPFLVALALGKEADIHHEIIATYNFHPHTLSHEQIAEKSTLLDVFWAKATAHRDLYLPALRNELADFSNPSFFLYDGSKLLLSLSKDPSDRKIVLAAIPHSDLQDLQRDDYFYLVHSMAAQGENTTTAAFHILEDPGFKVFIPQHVLTLAQNYSLVYMLLPTEQSYWEHDGIARLQTEKDPTAQQSLLLLLFYAQTEAADKAIAAFGSDVSKPGKPRAYARELAKRSAGLTSKAASLLPDQARLRQQRRERMKAVSDEALLDLDSMTAQIIAKRK